MKRNLYAVVINGRIEMWPPEDEELDGVEQMEVYATREWAERVKNLYVERTGSKYKVLPVTLTTRPE